MMGTNIPAHSGSAKPACLNYLPTDVTKQSFLGLLKRFLEITRQHFALHGGVSSIDSTSPAHDSIIPPDHQELKYCPKVMGDVMGDVALKVQ